jgi:hypothetical protein
MQIEITQAMHDTAETILAAAAGSDVEISDIEWDRETEYTVTVTSVNRGHLVITIDIANAEFALSGYARKGTAQTKAAYRRVESALYNATRK